MNAAMEPPPPEKLRKAFAKRGQNGGIGGAAAAFKDIAPEKFIFPEKTDDTKVIKDIVEEDEVSSKYYLSTAYLTSLKRHKERHVSKGNGFGYEIREAKIGRAHV